MYMEQEIQTTCVARIISYPVSGVDALGIQGGIVLRQWELGGEEVPPLHVYSLHRLHACMHSRDYQN